jgi:4-hydroxy-tetrahydrodipicolinate synthase
MQRADWAGVFPAITTTFQPDGSVDETHVSAHVAWMLEHGSRGIVPLGSLGEGATLSFAEKVRIIQICVAVAGPVPVVPGISGLSTDECVALARAAAGAGASGLMVLPPYVYRGDTRETDAHFGAVLGATKLPAMLYNNPIAYGTDLLAADVVRLADRFPQVQAVKESSGDVRRVTALRERLGDRLALFVGLDDMIVEACGMGADGWVAGLVNALPAESVELFRLAHEGSAREARALYEWFLPLLRLDTVPKFVQLIKLVQQEVGRGSETVRPPRLPLEGHERTAALELIRASLSRRPAAGVSSPTPAASPRP